MATTFDIEEGAFSVSFQSHVRDEASSIAVAELDGEVVGYCLGYDRYAFHANGRVSWVEEIFVLEEHRQRGVGKALMAHFERWSRRRGSKLVALATRRAAAFYQAIGYEESAEYYRKLLC